VRAAICYIRKGKLYKSFAIDQSFELHKGPLIRVIKLLAINSQIALSMPEIYHTEFAAINRLRKIMGMGINLMGIDFKVIGNGY